MQPDQIDRNFAPPDPVLGAAWVNLGRGNFALIDEGDAAAVLARRWHLSSNGYPTTRITVAKNTRRNIRLHRFLMGNKDGLQVDHINRNKLDNRRENLRWVTARENMTNQDRVPTGASYDVSKKRKKRWKARVWIDGRDVFLGLFATKEEAQLAYHNAAASLTDSATGRSGSRGELRGTLVKSAKTAAVVKRRKINNV